MGVSRRPAVDFVVQRRYTAAPPRPLRTRETDGDAARRPNDGDGDTLHDPLWSHHCLSAFAQRFLETGTCIGDVDVGDAARYFRRIGGTNATASLVRIRE